MKYGLLLMEVAARIGVDPPDRVALLTRSVLVALAVRLSAERREQVAGRLPPTLGELVRSMKHMRKGTAVGLVHDVAEGSLGTTPERARYGVQAVLSALADVDPQLAEVIRADLPADYGELFTAPGDGPPPDRAASAAEEVPTNLSGAQVRAALRHLPGWRGDTRQLSRTVSMRPELDAAMMDRVHAAESELQHRAAVERSGPDTTFRVWTHSTGVVTDLDVELAERITDAIEGF
jgi:pterin-4a-carbinolamine dehydratase/uncharacterized protein (DUF2267 family)